MNESGFIRAVHSKLPKSIYRWKVSDRFSAGVADAYYSSKKADLWIEYKYYKDGLPKTVTPNLSKLQIKWLNERHDEGRNVFVIVGSPTTCLIYKDKEWNSSKANAQAISRQELINWISNQLC
jgi:hypothetical protein